MKVALTIAGSDSGGGAGIQADLKTFHQFGVFGTSAIAAITAQNTLGVSQWQPVDVGLVRAQIEAVASDLHPAATKTGMLGSRDIVVVVAESIRRYRLSNYVLDPVMVATSGDLLIETDAVGAIRSDLLPLAFLVTPNAGEARVIAGFPVENEDDMRRAATAIAAMGAGAVLIKGGHVRGGDPETVVDLLYDGEFTMFTNPRIDTTSTHGTGCTLSAAITAELAKGAALRDAVRSAIDFVHTAMATAPGLGSGHGPLNHFAGGSAATNSRTSA
ncbi:MAG: bifunctional hydroxymethylpyrimidine kinase/phosphomethylpyrimidine kinase [Gemmatimonadaceae bacterium]|nr:bifunctional hydroxymethylpyrimidine kinase/phosphomethylpyrimidine kinase [Gemmatimonadaceae bacterium]